MAIVGLAIMIVGIIFMIYYPIIKKKTRRCTAQAPGRLLDIWESMADEYGGSRVEYTYAYYVDGIEYKLKTIHRAPEAVHVGDTCTIWFNPRNPKDAQSLHFEEKGLGKVFLVGIALLFVGLVLVIL